MLQGADFPTSVITVASSKPKGIVASQNPAAGTKVAPNTPISLNVSDGSGYTPAPSTVPNVVGMTEANAKTLLESKRFIVSVGWESTTDPSLDGVVLSQTPAAGTKGSEGDKVRITVGRYRQ